LGTFQLFAKPSKLTPSDCFPRASCILRRARIKINAEKSDARGVGDAADLCLASKRFRAFGFICRPCELPVCRRGRRHRAPDYCFWNLRLQAYLGWHESRLLKRAGAMLEENDSLQRTPARRSWRATVTHFPLLHPAEATEKQNSEETVSWRAQIARLQPDNIDSQLNLASAALRFGQIDLARKTLERVAPRPGPGGFPYVAGWLARSEGNLAEQEHSSTSP